MVTGVSTATCPTLSRTRTITVCARPSSHGIDHNQVQAVVPVAVTHCVPPSIDTCTALTPFVAEAVPLIETCVAERICPACGVTMVPLMTAGVAGWLLG